jgi:hypothetical protein
MAGLGDCAATLPQTNKLMAQTAADFFDQLFNVVGSLQSGDRKNECVVLFEILLQLLG